MAEIAQRKLMFQFQGMESLKKPSWGPSELSKFQGQMRWSRFDAWGAGAVSRKHQVKW
jgi:hypothetical protein